MKLIKEEFENYAQGQGYENGEELFDYLGGNIDSYRRYKKQIPINKETFTRICWEIGMSNASDFIKFEFDEKARYCKIAEEF